MPAIGFSNSQPSEVGAEAATTSTKVSQQESKTTNSSSSSINHNVAQNRQRLSKLLQLHGYSACREALVLLEDHFSCSSHYESLEDFISRLNRIITFETEANTSIIDPDLAHLAIKKLTKAAKRQQAAADGVVDLDADDEEVQEEPVDIPTHLNIRIKSVQYDDDHLQGDSNVKALRQQTSNDFNIHYNFLFKRLNTLPIFQGDFQLMRLETLTGSTQPNIRCICFGLLVKDISKIDGYLLIDSTGRVPVKITPDTTFRNRLAYSNCIVLVEGVYVNPDDVLFAANVGLPPILLDPIEEKSLACVDDKLVIILRELFLDDEDVVNALDMLFTGYNSMEDPPAVFILIGDFTRQPCDEPKAFKVHMRKLIRILRTCDNLKGCHFVFVPGPKDTTLLEGQDEFNIKKVMNIMPKSPLTEEQVPINLLRGSNFENIHLTTNPTHIYLGDRQISVVAHSYLKELRKNLLHDLSDHREELFETAKQIILSNAHLAAGVTKTYNSSMNMWHKPDLLILADTEATGNRYDYSSARTNDTSFTTIPSFSCSFNQFRVYYLKTGEIEDSQVSVDAMQDLEEDEPIIEDCFINNEEEEMQHIQESEPSQNHSDLNDIILNTNQEEKAEAEEEQEVPNDAVQLIDDGSSSRQSGDKSV